MLSTDIDSTEIHSRQDKFLSSTKIWSPLIVPLPEPCLPEKS